MTLAITITGGPEPSQVGWAILIGGIGCVALYAATQKRAQLAAATAPSPDQGWSGDLWHQLVDPLASEVDRELVLVQVAGVVLVVYGLAESGAIGAVWTAARR